MAGGGRRRGELAEATVRRPTYRALSDQNCGGLNRAPVAAGARQHFRSAGCAPKNGVAQGNADIAELAQFDSGRQCD